MHTIMINTADEAWIRDYRCLYPQLINDYKLTILQKSLESVGMCAGTVQEKLSDIHIQIQNGYNLIIGARVSRKQLAACGLTGTEYKAALLLYLREGLLKELSDNGAEPNEWGLLVIEDDFPPETTPEEEWKQAAGMLWRAGSFLTTAGEIDEIFEDLGHSEYDATREFMVSKLPQKSRLPQLKLANLPVTVEALLKAYSQALEQAQTQETKAELVKSFYKDFLNDRCGAENKICPVVSLFACQDQERSRRLFEAALYIRACAEKESIGSQLPKPDYQGNVRRGLKEYLKTLESSQRKLEQESSDFKKYNTALLKYEALKDTKAFKTEDARINAEETSVSMRPGSGSHLRLYSMKRSEYLKDADELMSETDRNRDSFREWIYSILSEFQAEKKNILNDPSDDVLFSEMKENKTLSALMKEKEKRTGDRADRKSELQNQHFEKYRIHDFSAQTARYKSELNYYFDLLKGSKGKSAALAATVIFLCFLLPYVSVMTAQSGSSTVLPAMSIVLGIIILAFAVSWFLADRRVRKKIRTLQSDFRKTVRTLNEELSSTASDFYKRFNELIPQLLLLNRYIVLVESLLEKERKRQEERQYHLEKIDQYQEHAHLLLRSLISDEVFDEVSSSNSDLEIDLDENINGNAKVYALFYGGTVDQVCSVNGES